jgi:cyclophilin family peptidyl-prolyl cis-trans isomerase
MKFYTLNAMRHLPSLFVSGLIGVLILHGCASPDYRPDTTHRHPFADEALCALYDAATARDVLAMQPYATHDTAAYRMAWARLMGSVQDPDAATQVAELLTDPIPYVRLYAAWSIGQYRDTLLLGPIAQALKKATIPEIKAELLESMGKCANAAAMELLIAHVPSTAIEEEGKLWGIYHATAKGLLREDHLRVVAAHLESLENTTRLAAAHILARQSKLLLTGYKDLLLRTALKDPSFEVRAAAALALRSTGLSANEWENLARRDPHPVVRAIALRNHPEPNGLRGQQLILDCFEDGAAIVAMEAAARVSEVYDAAWVVQATPYMRTSQVPDVRGAILAKTIAVLPDAGWPLFAEMRRNSDPHTLATLLKHLSTVKSAVDTLMALCYEPPPVGTAAAKALVQGAELFPGWRHALRQMVLQACQSRNASLCALFGESLTPLLAGENPREIVDHMRSTAATFTEVKHFETRKSLLEGAARLSGERNPQVAPPTPKPINWGAVRSIPAQATATIYTKAGRMELQLLIEDAPATVASFTALAESGYFDAKVWHRVVPGFVSQTGCPLGDGYGSINHTLPSEFSPLFYGTGVVGMASAGPHTEGSQWFVTHAPAPHLNGRYTIFAAATSGMEVLYNLPAGAVIDSVRVTK